MRSFDSDKNVLLSIGKTLYGALFTVLLPLILILWANRLDGVLNGPQIRYMPVAGWLLIIAGSGLLLAGWHALIRHGKGLPMNAYPPQYLVKRGIYSVVPHPIYTGFTMMAAGYFIISRSSAGLWIVTPCIALGALALVSGYERHDMKRRFGHVKSWALLHLPENDDEQLSGADRLSCYTLVFLPWLVLYEAALLLGLSASVESYLPFEHEMPVLAWTEGIYAATYLFVLIAPLVGGRRRALRRFMIMGWWATGIGITCFLLVPLKATPRPFEPTNFPGQLLMAERMLDGPGAAFPSFHVIWAFLAAWLYTKTLSRPVLWYGMAAGITASCISTGMHSLADIAAGFAVFLTVLNGKAVWRALLRNTERIANSWHEWRIGRVRIINHGLYPAIGVFLGMIAIAHMTGPGQTSFVVLTSIASLAGAGLWGQAIEGSSKLSRPFGYYGGVFGWVAGILVSAAMGGDGWLLAGAFAVAAPFIQMMGRLRCLVQGCCHGRPCDDSMGIEFIHERSRVVKLANLGCRPVYPTQLYSILYNMLLGALLIRAWSIALPMPFIVGSYFLLSGLARFVEESYRGEPQTPVYAGLAIYQWLAIGSVLIGAVLMTMQGTICATALELQPWVFVYSALFGLFTAFAMGVDFPDSNKRFSRLAQ